MIRRLEERDLPTLRALSSTFAWEFGPDFVGALVETDENDVAVMAVGAWHRCEVHMALDKAHGTPMERWQMLERLHKSMDVELAGVGHVVTWLDGMERFARRLMTLGWIKNSSTSFSRKVGV